MAGQLRPGGPEEVGMSARRIRQIVSHAERWVADGKTRALVVLAARRGIIVVEEAFGTLTPAADSPPLQRDSLFSLASITKVLTATAAMCLVDDGLLSLNRPVQEYVPEFRGAGKDAIMVHHLLTHTSGLRDEDLDAHAASKPDHPISSPAANQSPATYAHLELRSDAPLAKPPGQEVLYLNYGFVLLGDIVRRISGQSLGSFADDRIFRPLGMGDTSFGVPEAQRARLVRRPATSPTAFLESPERLDGTSPPGPGGAFGTARDLAVFGQMFLQRGSYGPARVLSPASVAQMTHNQTPGLAWRFDDEYFPEASRGLGWNVRGSKRMRYGPSLLSDQTFQHYGAGGVWLCVDPVHEVVVVYLSLILAPFPGVDAPWNADLFANAVIAAIDT